MVNNRNPSFANIEFLNISADTSFFFYLLKEIIDIDHSSTIIFNLMPYFSLFCVESLKWIDKKFPASGDALILAHKEIISSSRNRIKMFDDRSEDIVRKIQFTEFIVKSLHKISNYSNVGLIGLLKRLFQCDMGLFLYENVVISSTFTNIFNLGYSEIQLDIQPRKFYKVLGKISKSIGYDIGRYVGSIGNALSLTEVDFSGLKLKSKEDFYYYDVKARHFLPKIFPFITNNALKLFLLNFLTELNFLRAFDFLINNHHVTLFKLKYIILFHIVSSLKKLSKYAYVNGKINRDASDRISKMVGSSEIKIISKQKKFRNSLIHYEIRDIPASQLNDKDPLFGFVEYYFSGRSYSDLENMVNIGLYELSKSLTELMEWSPREVRINNF